jgi:hypothetical protein
VVNRATVAFRSAASTLLCSDSDLGAQYRPLAHPRKLACFDHRLIKHGNSTSIRLPHTTKAGIASNKFDSSPKGEKLGFQ